MRSTVPLVSGNLFYVFLRRRGFSALLTVGASFGSYITNTYLYDVPRAELFCNSAKTETFVRLHLAIAEEEGFRTPDSGELSYFPRLTTAI